MPQRAQARARAQAPLTPSPRPALSPEFVAVHKRRRIMDAIAELTAEQGYDATKIADIVRRAAVARKTLYDNFDGKEEVFLAAFDAAVDEAMARIEAECAKVEGDWEERVQVGLAAFLGYVAEEPALARMCMIEALSATPAATERYEDAMQRFVDLTRQNVPQDDQLPETIEETLVGGVAWIVYQQIRRHETEKAEDLLPELSEFMLAPFHGAAEAARKRANA
jgi:AcrR family transcriptional regulator